jgi:hypothetical protein
MARNTAKLFLQRLRYPVADRPVLGTGPLAHSPDQTLGQLDGEDVFVLRNGHGSRLLLGGLHVASRLASRHAKLSGQARDDLGRTQWSVQELKGLVHAPGVLGYRRPAQDDL